MFNHTLFNEGLRLIVFSVGGYLIEGSRYLIWKIHLQGVGNW